MNQVITSKEAIMQECRRIVSQQGMAALNMRTVARECNIALGTLYNYYSNKDDLLIATVESVWKDIFRMDRDNESGIPFPEYVSGIIERVQAGLVEYPDFFMAHTVGITSTVKGKAMAVKENCFGHIRHCLTEALHNDPQVSADVFSSTFTESDLVDIVFGNILMHLVQGKSDHSALIEVIRRVIYR